MLSFFDAIANAKDILTKDSKDINSNDLEFLNNLFDRYLKLLKDCLEYPKRSRTFKPILRKHNKSLICNDDVYLMIDIKNFCEQYNYPIISTKYLLRPQDYKTIDFINAINNDDKTIDYMAILKRI